MWISADNEDKFELDLISVDITYSFSRTACVLPENDLTKSSVLKHYKTYML